MFIPNDFITSSLPTLKIRTLLLKKATFTETKNQKNQNPHFKMAAGNQRMLSKMSLNDSAASTIRMPGSSNAILNAS